MEMCRQKEKRNVFAGHLIILLGKLISQCILKDVVATQHKLMLNYTVIIFGQTCKCSTFNNTRSSSRRALQRWQWLINVVEVAIDFLARQDNAHCVSTSITMGCLPAFQNGVAASCNMHPSDVVCLAFAGNRVAANLD